MGCCRLNFIPSICLVLSFCHKTASASVDCSLKFFAKPVSLLFMLYSFLPPPLNPLPPGEGNCGISLTIIPLSSTLSRKGRGRLDGRSVLLFPPSRQGMGFIHLLL